MNTKITKRMTFCAGHRLYNPQLSDEKNLEIYGPCSHPGGHGHNYILEVTVSGAIDPKTGMIINLRSMKEIISREIIAKVDHKNLNSDVDFMRGIIPTTENFAAEIWKILDRSFGGELLQKIMLRETENNCVEICR